MERLPKIIIMIAAMTAIFLWVSTAFNSCGDKDLIDDSDDFVSETSEGIDYSDEVGEGIFGSSDDDDDDDFLFDDEEDPEEYIPEENEEEDAEVDFTTPVAQDNYQDSKPVSKPNYSSSGEEWMVIAGNYLVESNARVMMKKLRNLGYNNSEIGVFERSQYHTVIASRHSSHSAAISASNKIKNRGVECYVKKKTF